MLKKYCQMGYENSCENSHKCAAQPIYIRDKLSSSVASYKKKEKKRKINANILTIIIGKKHRVDNDGVIILSNVEYF